jgi:hypothetical protein
METSASFEARSAPSSYPTPVCRTAVMATLAPSCLGSAAMVSIVSDAASGPGAPLRRTICLSTACDEHRNWYLACGGASNVLAP